MMRDRFFLFDLFILSALFVLLNCTEYHDLVDIDIKQMTPISLSQVHICTKTIHLVQIGTKYMSCLR